ncbi:MAG: hypothetical protein ACP5I4_13370 [Oceanipulchritudo sp.]
MAGWDPALASGRDKPAREAVANFGRGLMWSGIGVDERAGGLVPPAATGRLPTAAL